MAQDPSKTEKATPKKRRDERKKGNVFMSQDAVSVATLFAAILMLRLTFPGMAEAVGDFLRYCVLLAGGGVVAEVPRSLLMQSAMLIARTVGPLLAVVVFVAVAATMAQTRLLVTAEKLKPKLEHISPIKGFKRLFSMKSLVTLLENLLKISVLLFLIYSDVRALMGVSPRYMYADLSGAIQHILNAIFSLLLKVALGFFVLAVLDFFYQHYDFEKQMRMSKQEIKEEYKQTEGDPQIKGKIKQLQRQMSQQRMMQQVPKADVVVRNPTHVAVALRYHAGEDVAPVVLAMGVDSLALRIVEVAEANGVTVLENVSLARALFVEAELNRPIPSSLYEAVAEVMVYLYKLGKLQAS